MPRNSKDVQMLAIQKVKRINHVAELCRKKGWDKKQFIRQAMYYTTISDRTLEKAYDGETKLDMNTVENLAQLFDVSKDEVLESVW